MGVTKFVRGDEVWVCLVYLVGLVCLVYLVRLSRFTPYSLRFTPYALLLTLYSVHSPQHSVLLPLIPDL